MDLESLAYRTDLALLTLGGTEVADRGDPLVARTRDNPNHWWGNFLLLAAVPAPEDAPVWLERFAAEFPGAGHLTLGFDGTQGSTAQLGGFRDRGLRPEAATVMTARQVHPPAHAHRTAVYRELTTDDDWARSVDLRMRCDDEHEPLAHRTFITAKAATNRRLVEAGHGAWFGAFVDDRLVAQLGLLRAETELARYQSVETDPAHRRQGLAGALVHHAGRTGLDRWGVRTLVMVADPDYFAVDLYRAVGFVSRETQLQVERPPALE